jgi:hypothetical protein
VNYDLGDHVLLDDTGALPGVTIAPPAFFKPDGLPPSLLEGAGEGEQRHRRRYLLSYHGLCQDGLFDSSHARPVLQLLFAGAAADARVHFECVPTGGPPGTHGEEASQRYGPLRSQRSRPACG